MTPKQLRLVRTFFEQNDGSIDNIVALTFANFFRRSPESAALFQGAMTEHRQTFTTMLRKVISLTRASHLWPVSAGNGQVEIPGVAALRERHMRAGVSAMHTQAMKESMLEALETACPRCFTDDVREAFMLFYDVVTHSLMQPPRRSAAGESELQVLLGRQQAPLPASFDSFFADAEGHVPAGA